MNLNMNQRKQTTERSKIREQEALKRRIALLEEENGILKQAVEIAERANAERVICRETVFQTR
jgi:predicted HTH domain antitoxin